MNGIKLEGRRLKVQFAKHEMANQKHSSPPSNPKPKTFIPIHKHSLRDQRSYKDVSLSKDNNKPSQTQPRQLNPSHPKTPTLEKIQEIEPQPEFFYKNPSEERIISSKLLGEATEEARNTLIE